MSESNLLSHYIDGRWEAAAPVFDSLNPSDTRDIVARVPSDTGAAVDAAVRAARAAFPAWAAATPETRSEVLDRVGTTILARREELQGCWLAKKARPYPRASARSRAPGTSSSFSPEKRCATAGDTVDSTRPGIETATYREPVGVFGLITPWNFPIAIPAWKSAPALCFGNTVVMKPSELTPAMAIALARIVHEAGAPAGVFNIVLGGGQARRGLVRTR